MFKKSGILLIVMLYLATATGFALNLHFCGNLIESVKINAPTQKCGMNPKCCKNTHLDIKVKDAHRTAHTSFTAQISVSIVPVLSDASFREPSTINPTIRFVSERGPPMFAVPVYLKNCTFRI